MTKLMRLNGFESLKNWCMYMYKQQLFVERSTTPALSGVVSQQMLLVFWGNCEKGLTCEQFKQNHTSVNAGQCLRQTNDTWNIRKSDGRSSGALFQRLHSYTHGYSLKADYHTLGMTRKVDISVFYDETHPRCSLFQRYRAVHQQSGEDPKSMTPVQKLKLAAKVYGGTVIVFHVAISLVSLGCCYLAVTSGLDLERLLTALNISSSRVATAGGGFVLAYAIHKVFAPARIALTLTCTPFLVRYFRRVGILKGASGKK